MYVNKINKYKFKIENILGGEPNIKNNKLLGRGTFGCIISPPLKCNGHPSKPIQPNFKGLSDLQIASAKTKYISDLKGYTSLYKNKVSKLMLGPNADEEFANTRILVDLDPDNNFLIYPTSICDVDVDNLHKIDGKYINAIQECEINFQVPDNNLKLLYLPYSGKIITKLILNHTNIPNLFSNLINILNGINILHSKNIVHLDIKAENILVSKDGDNFKPKIIDFGFMMHIPDFFSYKNPQFFKSYFIWPVEFKFLDINFLGATTDDKMKMYIEECITPYIPKFRDNMKKYLLSYGIPYTNFLYQDSVKNPLTGIVRDTPLGFIYDNDSTMNDLLFNISTFFLDVKIIEWKRTLPRYNKVELQKIKLIQGTYPFELYSKILKGVDIYSIGILFYEIYITYIGQVVSFDVNMYGKKYEILDINYFRKDLNHMDPILIEYLNLLFDELTLPYSEFCNNCMNLKVIERFNASMALEQFNTKIIPRLVLLSDPRFELLYKFRK